MATVESVSAELAYRALAISVGDILTSVGQAIADEYPPERREDVFSEEEMERSYRLADEMAARFFRLVESEAGKIAARWEEREAEDA